MPKVSPLCDPFAWENPEILLQTGLWPKMRPEGTCVSELLNQVMLVYILAFATGIVLAVVSENPNSLWITVTAATLFLAPSFWYILYPTTSPVSTAQDDWRVVGQKYTQIEPFQTEAPTDEPKPMYDVIGSSCGGGAPALATLPTARNPFMNILIDEIKYNPTRPAAMAINDPSMKIGLDDFFRTEFTSDPTDVFGRSQSQRQFITQPSTSIPNDQESYQNWLYKIDGKTCKEGGREACLPGTDGGALPWLNADF